MASTTSSNSTLTANSNVTESAIDLDVPEIARSQPYSGAMRARTQLALSLPPLYKLSDIYKSLADKAINLGLDEVLEYLGERPLRVVTVCSGTEAPLLALEMVKDNLRKHSNKNLNFKHLFSAEIVPFKQAYIERNFHPPLLFRDVAELKDRVAQTAYGATEKIPKNADILIAGFACVDFSVLNNHRKTLDEKGESGGTFWGIIRYAMTYRPRLVILENVKSAPWEKITKHWNEIDYFAIRADVDTKAYYLPQTRERVYMFCVDKRLMDGNGLSEEDMRAWTEVLAKFKRPASSPAGMFLMDVDDRRLEQIERDMAMKIASSASSARATVNWAKYQVRHQNYRLSQGLGHRRPVSKSQDDGTCRMPDFAWQTWVKSLPERVWDTIDVNFLRKLAEGCDMNYKERCLELSQGIDREIDSRAYGIVGCITPCGIPYMTTRGGPLCGLESLGLQGLPLDRLLLTQETQRELQDLAGNAMSSPVVGAAILSALIVGHKVLKKGNVAHAANPRALKHKIITPQENTMIPSPMLLDSSTAVDLPNLRVRAASSARYCMCERQSSTRAVILKCTLCSHTACSECSGNPTHAYERWTDLERSAPFDFISELRSILPARLLVHNLSREEWKATELDHPGIPHIWDDFWDALLRVPGDELRFLDVKRGEVWTAVYGGKYSFLNLVIGRDDIVWQLFAKPHESYPAISLIREILSKPIARMKVPQVGSLLEGTWEICSPISTPTPFAISGSGDRVPSYEARCGLELGGFQDSKVWTHITVQGPLESIKYLEFDIRGTYELLQDCGTANACLHKRPAASGQPAMYLFLDPTKLGEPKLDAFVFSLEHRRNQGYGSRSTIAEITHTWRSSNVSERSIIVKVYHRKWLPVEDATLRCYGGDVDEPIRCYNLDPDASFCINKDKCHDTNITLMSFEGPVGVIDTPPDSAEWTVTDPTDASGLLRDHAWLLQKAAAHSWFGDWKQVAQDELKLEQCYSCVPEKPKIIWGRNRRGWLRAYEDPYGAARYERQVKLRPPPFLICRRTGEQRLGDFRITLNIQTLLHQAISKLVNSCVDSCSLHWRLVPNSYDTRNMVFPKFVLRNNKQDLPSSQPPRFLLELRPEQLRSLSWMANQEADDIEPFTEEEIEEALLPTLMWRAEGRVAASKTVRGGILADDVGYGKTAIVLGLIDSQYGKFKFDTAVSLNDEGFIPSDATLIVVPSIMLQQWQSEIAKFLGDKYRVLVFPSAAALAKTTIADIRDSDIILVSWSVFNTPAYYQRMQKFCGASRVPSKPGRYFDDWFLNAHQLMKDQVQILAEQGPAAFLNSLRAARDKVKPVEEDCIYVPSRRLRGKQYELAQGDKNKEASTGVSYADVSSDDENSEMSDEDDPNSLADRVHKNLELAPPKSFGIKHEEVEGGLDAYSTDEDTECDTISSERCHPRTQQKGNSRKRKSGQATPGSKRQSTWNDRKQFSIDKNAESQQWETLTAAFFHAFEFNRLVVDEFTYANTDRLSQLLSLRAHSKWVLSGTPPLNDFADVNTIAPFLGVHLGVDDDGDIHSQNRRLKSLHRQRSEAETFQSFQSTRSEAWHRRRHEVAQIFLDRFARRNVAEIDEIPSTEHIILVEQSPAEKVVYLELYKQLMTYNRQLRRSGGRGRFGSDQADRLDEIIESSSTAEEALLKRCTSLALQGRWNGDGQPEAATCQSLINVRLEQLAKLKDEFKDRVKLAAWVYNACDVKYEKFHKFIESVVRHDFGDMLVTEEAYPLIKDAIFKSHRDDWKLFFASLHGHANVEIEGDDAEETSSNQAKRKSKDTLPLPMKPTRVGEFEPMLREVTTTIRNLIVEWVLRERALRFLGTALQVQTGSQKSFPCHRCLGRPESLAKMNILGSCGHALCSNCTPITIEKEECAVIGCRGSGKKFNVINAMTFSPNDLGGDRNMDQSSRYGGTKLDALVNIIQNRVPVDERVLLFIQFPDLMQIASKALDLARIKHITIFSTDRQSTQKIEQFQKTSFGENKVLLLNLGSEMAAGLNLQYANHIIFLSPLLTQTQYDYESSMIQAIGRCRRYGQSRHVHVHHLLAKMTIDVNIFQDRRDKVVVERGGEAVLVSAEEASKSEAISCQGPELVVDNAF
ncbi:hypothetical protein ASPCAL00677 [Aspergillus calidoustus]|uniref:Helicase C-terminal domain-containing protein n=1 Tax=Aspergillus calidoustus TaxID=454130 RepID=A0A0U5FR61_ASPCI|nr:hypothetical protein ASPCAL00677 [Aspergillus calidoustus]